VTGKSWKKAIIELGTPAAVGPLFVSDSSLSIANCRHQRVLVGAVRRIQAIRPWNEKNGSGSVSRVSV
jgi:hypothetical protein